MTKKKNDTNINTKTKTKTNTLKRQRQSTEKTIHVPYFRKADGARISNMTFSVHHHKKNDKNTRQRHRQRQILKQTTAKYRKGHTCVILLKSIWCKDIKYDILSASSPEKE